MITQQELKCLSPLPTYQPILHFEGISHVSPKCPDQFPQPREVRSESVQPLLPLKVVQELLPLPRERDLAPALKANEVIGVWINL